MMTFKPDGKDDRYHPVCGPFHVHVCERCRVPVACFNGPGCDRGQIDGYCSQECYDRVTPEGSRAGQAVEGI